MSNTSTVTKPKMSVWDGGNSPLKASYGKLMMWFFILSDALTFFALLIAYGLIRYKHPAFEGSTSEFVFSQEYWPLPEVVFNAFPGFEGVHLPLLFVVLMTFILALSSVTMVLAVEAGNRMDKDGVVKWLGWTILGGVAFLACMAWEWSHFIHGTPEGGMLLDGSIFHGATLSVNQYGPPAYAAVFFFVTGFHGLHVFSGIVLNIYVFYNAVIGTFDRRGHYEMVEKSGLYWHFVDLVWVFVFTFFYLI
ncbi:MAG: cytochrome c oxidase subunit 3 [Cyclobacteriaceae bacterium]|nr:cytochrome c oxidase subunit 3 [Cyclobacteriaceae bacterium]MCH8515168.1 cytochrome c oxidase subunit 3 [Cyclobacteriaceae bacterium]